MVKDKTVIYISHRMSSCKFCDRIVVLKEGKIAETGTHQELSHSGENILICIRRRNSIMQKKVRAGNRATHFKRNCINFASGLLNYMGRKQIGHSNFCCG